MATSRTKPRTIDEYLAGFSPAVQALLQKIRQVVRSAAPDAQETISYGMPAFMLNGALVYFAAFKKHIKGNLRFPLDQPIPFDLIARIARLRVKQNLAKAKASSKKKRIGRAPTGGPRP